SSRRRHTRFSRDWSSDVCSSDLVSGVAHRVSDMAAPEPAAHAAPAKKSKAAAAQAASMVDPMQWWGALTQQFQQIATDAMKDARSEERRVGKESGDQR